ncbi:MAG: hypothetical protein HUJ27_15315 [Rhodobacteraceae bacterium]|nr:hypothetical protein [Paracoccaceae bacterium]
MKGWSIFVHAVRMVLNNIDVALRISAVPYGIVIILTLAMLFTSGFNFLGAQQPMVMHSGGFWTALFVLYVLWIVMSVWIAISWHRFVLLAEVPEGLVSRFRGGPVIKYIGVSFLLGLMVGIILVVVVMIVGFVLAAISPHIGPVIAGLLGFFLFFAIFYRLTPVLPAIAIEKRVSFGESWTATGGQTGTIILVALILTVLSVLFSLPSLMSSQINPYIDLIYSLVTNWVVTMFGVSVMTTLYGHYIEGRALD